MELECQPLRQRHVIDRRDWLKDASGNYILVKGEKQLNYRCVCGKLSGHAAEYTGGEFVYVHDDTEAKPFAVKHSKAS